jgi:hypothetical protein
MPGEPPPTGEDNFGDVMALLQDGRVETEGLVPWGSNYTFRVHVEAAGRQVDAIYKPSRGERPLWDFPRGSLCLRERAAFLVSEGLGWRLVPPTVVRDGPYGWGSMQLYVEHDPQEHYLTFQGRFTEQAQRIALFDAIINNADRKSGHVLLGSDRRLWAIDHGVTFHSDPKLRSVIWEFAGRDIPDDMLDDLARWLEVLCRRQEPAVIELARLLTDRELEALRVRLELLVTRRCFPAPGAGRYYPWPLV